MAKTPLLNILPNCQLSIVPPTQSSDYVLQEAPSWHCHREGRNMTAGWREVGAATSPAELLVRRSTNTRHPSRWAGGAGVAAKGLSTGRPPPCLFRLPTPPVTCVPSELQEFLLTCMDEGLARSSGRSSIGVTVCLVAVQAASRVSFRWQ